jgi:hypothetical protein
MITYYIETQVPVVSYMLIPITQQVKFFEETIYD